MGRRSTNQPGGKTLPLTVDERGNIPRYDAIVKQNENAKKIVYSEHHTDLVLIFVKDNEKEDEEMDVDEKQQKEIDETTKNTKAALEKIVNVKLSAAQPKNIPAHESKFIKYKPSQQQSERIIRMAEMPDDPLEPPKFKHKRIPKASGSPPVPVMHSPPPPVTTARDQQDWKNIPPCISNWKNPKGYTIPLDKRLAAAADGCRGLDQEVQINDSFAKLSEALYVAEQKAREAVVVRSKVQKEMMLKEKEKKEMELRELAHKARSERTCVAPPSSAMPMPSSSFENRGGAINDNDMISVDYEGVAKESGEDRGQLLQREKIREERLKERERERRLEAAKDAATRKKRRKITRDRDRDISEKVALGMASGGARGGEIMYDQRLFNQEKGMMDSGFATDHDAYNIYDKSLFAAGPSAMNTLYGPKKDDADDEMYGGADEQLMKTERFKPDKAFAGTSERMGTRERPVEFEKDQPPEEDPFGLLQFFEEVKTGKKAMDESRSGAEWSQVIEKLHRNFTPLVKTNGKGECAIKIFERGVYGY